MKLRMIPLGITSLLSSSLAFAIPPVTLSAPTPAIAASYPTGSNTTLTYTVSNYVHERLPLIISGLSSPLQRVSVPNDCGNGLPVGNPNYPATCTIGVLISPSEVNAGSFISQEMQVNTGGRVPLKSTLSFNVAEGPIVTSFDSATGIAGGTNFIPGLGTIASTTITLYGFNLLSPGVCDITVTAQNYTGVPVQIFSDTSLQIPGGFPQPCIAFCNSTVTSTTYPGQSANCTNAFAIP